MKIISQNSSIYRAIRGLMIFSLLLVINILNTKAADYYWVGGSGNWSDYGNHWATTSGGNIFHTNIPTLNDDVYFDAASFTAPGQSVVFDNTFIYCNNMEWTGVTNNPSASGTVSTLQVYGSLKLVPDMTWTVRRVDFLGTNTGNTIESAGLSLDTLYFNGAGTYEILDDIICASIFIYDGTFSTNNFSITLRKFVAGLLGATVNVNLGTSVVTVSELFKAYDGTINMSSANADIVCANSVVQTILFWSANHTFRNLDFQARVEVIGSFTCERITTALQFYLNANSTNSLCQVAEFGGNTTLKGTFIADSLTVLNTGRFLKIEQLVINDYFLTNGICGAPNIIQPVDFAPGGTITMAAGAVVVDYCIINSINATGGASFTANNSVDGGNNSGWTINSAISRMLFWVGGTGDWDDTNNWSLTSGGPGGVCIPSSIDDVFFDANSFSQPGEIVTLNGVQATCHDLNWTGAAFTPEFNNSGLSNIFINGSLTLIPAMTLSYSNFSFVGPNTGNTIFTAGHYINGIFINGTGSWSLADELTGNSMQVYSGTFNTANYNVNLKGFAPNGINSSIFVNLGTSTLTIGENFMAFSPLITMNSTNASVIFENTSGVTIYAQFADVDFNEVTVNDYTYFYGNLTCNKFVANSGLHMNILNSPHATFDKSFSGIVFNVDSMILSQDVHLFTFDTLNVNDGFVTTTNCNFPMSMKPYTVAMAQFTKSTGTVDIEYVYVSNITASGGATFNANNSWSVGANSGWNFTTPASRDLYWVGGGGDWDDPAHWALTSNGAPGNCPPSLTDNIIFDSNSLSLSGETINIDDEFNSYCNNLNFSGIPAGTVLMSGSNSPIFVNGSVALVPELDPWALNLVMTSSSTGNTIHTGNNFIHGLRTSGTGEWVMQNPLECGNLYLQGGTFRTNGNNISAGGINTGGNTLIDFGTSTVTLLGFYSTSPSVTYIAGDANIIMTSSFLDFRVFGAHFNSVTFTGNANTQLNWSCNRLVAMGEFVNISAQITAGHATFNNKVTLQPIFVADTVTFNNPGHLVRISNMTVSDSIIANGNAGFPIQIEGYNGTGTLTKSSGVVCIDHVLLKDINATGGAQFFAGTGSVDLGGNSGWTFGACSPLTVVWPGDANYDLVVDNTDILNIGLAYGYTGPVRANASLLWTAQPATDWSAQFANGANLKHADTDGNGLVDADDTLAVSLNYGLTHPLRVDNNTISGLPSPVLYIVANPDTVFASDTVLVDIFLGDNTQPIDSIYGIAFTVNIDTALINSNYLSVDFTGCWMGTQQLDLLTFHKDLLTNGKVDFAIVRTDQLNTTGFGLLTRMGIVIVDNVGAKITTPVTVTNIKAITVSEYLLSILTEGDSIVIDTTGTTSILTIDGGLSGVMVYPNPVKDQLNINAGNVVIEQMEIYSLTGQLLSVEQPNRSRFGINTLGLDNGAYFIKLISKSGVIIQKVILSRD